MIPSDIQLCGVNLFRIYKQALKNDGVRCTGKIFKRFNIKTKKFINQHPSLRNLQNRFKEIAKFLKLPNPERYTGSFSFL